MSRAITRNQTRVEVITDHRSKQNSRNFDKVDRRVMFSLEVEESPKVANKSIVLRMERHDQSPQKELKFSSSEKKRALAEPITHEMLVERAQGRNIMRKSQKLSQEYTYADAQKFLRSHQTKEQAIEQQGSSTDCELDLSLITDHISRVQALTAEKRMLPEPNAELHAGIRDLMKQLLLALAVPTQ